MSDGKGCRCAAHSEAECGCPDVDWTPQELIELRQRVAELERLLAATSSELQTLKEGACVDQKLGATLIRQRDVACAEVSRLTTERDEAVKKYEQSQLFVEVQRMNTRYSEKKDS